MGFFELLLTAAALSMDAFAVSVCKGFSINTLNPKKILIIGFYFGFFQAFMPLLGYIFASIFSERIQEYAHWAAFILLCGIGVKMLIEALSNEQSCPAENRGSVRLLVMLPLAVATSLDALAAGISFSLLKVDILLAILLIGTVTFIISAAGVGVGHAVGMKYQKKAEITGGVILILLGIKVLLEHFGVM